MVTGASRGIGAAIARAFAAEGFRLFLAGRDRAALEAVAAPLREGGTPVALWAGELLEEGAMDRLAEAARAAVGVPYVLVNNAGAVRAARLELRSPGEVADELRLDLGVPLALARAFLPDLLGRGRGHLLNLGSGIADLPLPRLAVYAAAKSGLRGFSVALDRETRRRGVRSTVLEPIFVRTALGRLPGGGPPPIEAVGRRHPHLVLAPEVVARYAVGALYRPREIVRIPRAWGLLRPLLVAARPLYGNWIGLPPPRSAPAAAREDRPPPADPSGPR